MLAGKKQFVMAGLVPAIHVGPLRAGRRLT
jgi:hypothetical protein